MYQIIGILSQTIESHCIWKGLSWNKPVWNVHISRVGNYEVTNTGRTLDTFTIGDPDIQNILPPPYQILLKKTFLTPFNIIVLHSLLYFCPRGPSWSITHSYSIHRIWVMDVLIFRPLSTSNHTLTLSWVTPWIEYVVLVSVVKSGNDTYCKTALLVYSIFLSNRSIFKLQKWNLQNLRISTMYSMVHKIG